MASMVVQPSSTSTTPPPPPLNPPIKYDVFLSFRGADTRTKFTDHLYNELHVRKGIPTFRDSEELEKGEDLSQLFEAIEKSKIAVVILSSNYASSTWCLREVAKIVECRKKSGLIALPVFYEIEPTQVRVQTGSFKIHFDKHEQKFKDSIGRVNIWREALTEVADLSGWDLKDRLETTVIEEIVKCVEAKWKLKFNPAFSIEDSKDFVGMDRVRKIELDLDIETLDKIGVIGICGMPGVGKTTIAEVVFRRNWHHFEANSFLANVGEIRKTKGLLHIQKQLYRDLLDSKVITMNDVPVERRKLRHKKVLIILDGVTELESVVELAGRGGEELINWFGRGSRIIITTINEKLLKDYEAKTHKVETLSENEPRVLFFRKAFNNDHPLHDCPELDFKFKIDHPMRQYAELAYKFVDLTDGLPLAIVVLGSLLLNRSLDEWEAELRKLEANNDSNDEKTFGILKLCIDGLRDGGKEIFLDIACFFKGDDKKRVERIFESCGHNPGIELNILVEKSLVTIVGGKLWMHDLLQKAGQKMVIGQSKLLGERSRLWDRKEAVSVLKHDKGTSAVRGIFLSSPQQDKVRLKADSFAKMDFLRLLKIKNVIFSGCHEYDLSNELSFLEWHGFPSTSLPSDFEPENLVELHLPRSQIKQLWEDNVTPPLEKLVVMDLSDCKELTSTPDFQSVPNLESLVLKGCTRLSEVHLPTGDQLQKLISLNLEGCESLSSLPNGICSLRSLTTFILSGCSRLANLPEKIGENMKQLSGLDLEGTAIKGLPTSIKHLTGLIRLNLKDCKNLLCLPAVICSLTKLQVLNLSGCSNLAELPENLGSLVGLKELDASRSCIRQVPSSILLLKDLESLSFCGCGGLPPSACPMGLQLPASFSGLDSLTKLDLSYCKLSGGAIPADLDCLSSLNHLNLSGNSLVSVPESITKLSKLEVLLLNDCSELRSLPDLPSSIRRVFARNCPLLGTYSNKLTVWSSTATGFCFINSQSSEERKLQRIPISEQYLLRPHLQKFYEDIIYKGSGFEYITPHTEIPSWFGRQITGSSITLQLPLDYFDGKRELMGLALCFVYEAQEHENMESTASNISAQEVKYSCNYSCRLSTYGGPHDDCPLLVCKLMDHDYVGSFRHWVYIAGGLFAERLIKRSVRAEVIINRPGVEVKACGASLIYSGGVTEFVWNLNLPDEIHMRNLSSGDQKENSDDQFNKQEQETIGDHQLELKHVPVQYQAQMNRMISLYDTKRSYKRSLDHDAGSSSRTSSSTEEPHQRLEVPKSNDQSNKQDQETNYGCATDKRFLIEIEPHTSRYSSTSTTIFDDQLRTNLESFLEELFKLGGKARRNDLGFIFPLRAILPWFNHQCIGNVFIPEKEKIGSSVSLSLPLELYNNKEWVGFAVYVAFTLPPGVSLEKSCCFKSVLYTSDRHFHCLKLSAACEDNFRGAHRLLVIHIPRGRFKKQLNQCWGIRAAFVSSTPGVEAEMCGIRVVYEQDLKGLIQTITQCTITNPPAVYYGLAHSFVPDGRESFMLAIMEDNLIEAAKSSERKLSTLQEPLTDSKFLSGQQIYLKIEAGTPYMPHKFKDSIVDWRKNLELLLECFFTLSDLSINLTLNRSRTSFSRDFDPCSGIFLQKEISEWFTPQYPSESMVLELPPNLENDVNFMGLVVCASFSVHASEADVLKYLKPGLHPQLTCHFQNLSSDQSYGLTAPMIDASSENKFMWLYRRGFIWQEYLPCELFKDLLHKDTSVKVSFRSDSSQVLEVHKCSFRILYKQDVEKFKQMLIQCFTSFFDNDDVIRAYLVEDSGDYMQSLDHDAGSSSRTGSSTEEPLQRLERPESNDQSDEQVYETNSDLTHVAECGYASDTRFLLEIEPHTSRDNSSSTKIVGDQLRTNVESFLEELFELGGKARRYDLGFIFSLRAILPWFKHQGIGNVIGVPLPLQLYNNKECIGFALYVSFTLPPGAWLKEGSCFKIVLFTEEPRYCLNLSPAGEDNFMGSHRLLVIHIPRRHFGEQLNHWSTIRASFESLMPGVEVEMCGMRVVYQEDLKGLIQTITNCTICSPSAYYGLAQPFVPGRWSDVLTHMRDSLVEAAKSSKRKFSTLQEPLTDLKSIQGIQLMILAVTPFTSLKKTETVIKWKRNLKLLLQRFLTLSGLSISLILRGGRISFSEDHNLHTGIFFQKEIPDWFTPHHSASMVPELPPDLENDMNLMGFVVCAAFSVHASKADVLKYLDSGHHPELMCHFQSSSDYSGVVVRNMVGICPKNEFMWFYRRGFIWLHYVPRHNVEHLFNKLSELEVSFESDSSQVLAVQKCSFRFLYKQDVEGFKQTIIECFTSFFDNEDIIKPYIEEEDSGHNKWPNHGDEMGPSSTTGRNIVIEQTHNERLDVPITDRKGKGPSDVSSDEADERDYYGTTPVCQGETSGQASDQLELVTHVVEEEHGSSTSPAELIPFLSEIEPPASTGSSSTKFEGDQFRTSGKSSDQLELVTHVVEEEQGSSSSPPELIPFLFEIEPSTSTDSSSTKFEGDQFRTNVETLLAVMFRDKIKGFDFEQAFILSPRVGAILPWFNHQTIGSEALVLHLPPDLYKDKKWKGLALYVAFTVPPGYTENILCRCSLSTSAGHAEAITIECSQGNFSGSRRLCFIHKLRARFPEQWNTCSYISAFFEVLTPVVDVEMCGVHLVYEQDLIGIIQTITHCTIRNPPVYYGIGRANTPCRSQKGQPADINMKTNLNELAARTPSTAQEPVKTLVGQVIHLRIHVDTPFKKKDSVMEWKKNLEFLLQCFFRFPLSITLILGGDVISSLGDSDPYCLCSSSIIPQKDIPKWFCGVKYPTNKLKTTLPPNLENDENWLGFVVCAAFSVHASQADVLIYLDSENYPKLTCLLQWGSERALNLKAGKKTSIVLKNKFMWLYLRRFIWLRYIPHQKFTDRLHISDHLEASFRTDSISSKVLGIQECSLRVLYKKDVQEFKQTIIECFTSFFDNEDIIKRYIGEEDSGHNKWPNHGDEIGPSSTTGGNIVIEQTHNERLDEPITDRKGKGPSDVSSDEADERDYYGTTPVCRGETSGQASDQLELVTHVVEEEHGSSTYPAELIPFLSEIEPSASTGSSSTKFEGDQFRTSGKSSDRLELVTHVVEEEHGSNSPPPELIPFLFEIEPSASTDSSSTKFEGDQFRTSIETLLAQMFRDKVKQYEFERGFILSPGVGAILPWFNHQTIGSEALVLHLPPDLYKDKKWAGLALYVAFTVPPGYSENILCRCSLSTSAGHAEAITTACSQGNFSGSRRLCFIHKPRACFPEQWNKCSYICAFFEVLTPVVDVEMCGVHLVYEQDLIGMIQTITHCTIRSPPVYHGIGLANTPCQSQKGQPFADVHMDTNLNELATRTPSTSQEPVKTLVGQVIHLRIHGDTPFKKKDSVMEWKKNLEFLLQCFFRFPLSITLTLGGDVISSLGDSDPYCLCSSSIIPQKDIPKWFCGVKYPTNKLKTTLPQNLENDENWLGFVVCAAFSVHASQADVLGYLDSENYPKLTCLLQWGSERALNLKVGKKTGIVLKNEFTWLYLRRFIWLRYIPRQKFKDRLHISDHLEASFRTDSISSKVLRIQECSLRVLYKKDVEEFKQTIIECFTSFFDNEDVIRPYIEEEDSRHNKWPSHADDRDSYGTTPICQGERGSASSSSPEPMPFFIETEPRASTDSSSTKVSCQLRMIESSLEQLFQGDSARHYNYGFILSPRVRAVLPWFSHQSIGKEVKVNNAPPDLYKDKKWVGFALYVAFTQSPGSHSCSMCSLIAFPGHAIFSINTCLNEDQFSGSRRLCFFHIPRARFPEQCDQCPCIFARFDFSTPGSEVEMCGIRVVYDDDIKGLVQTITQSTIRSHPPVYFSQDEKTEISSWGQPLLRINMASSLIAHSKACILPTRSTRSPLVPSMKFGKVNLVIHGDAPLKKDTTEWKRDFEILLQYFFRLDLSVKLMLGEDTIAFYQDCFNHACLFPQKKIPDWFKEKSHTSTYVYRLPDDLESDNNWMGLVVCAAFSVHPLPTDLGNYKDSELSSDVKCNFRWSSDPSRFISIREGVFGVRPNNKFMWLSRRGFIWLQLISGDYFKFAMDKHHRQLEASFESGSPALSVQECSYQILYEQDLQEYKQTMIQCFASIFDNLDHSLPFKEDDSRHSEEPIHEDDQMDSLGTTSFSEDTPHGRETTVALPESETSGNSFNRFNSILFEPILYDNKTAVIFADFRGWEE